MKSKKLLIILFVVQLVLCLSLSVFAAEDVKLKFEVVFETVEPSGSIVKAGEEFSVLLNITENTGLAFLEGSFTFDPTQFTYLGFDGEGSVFGENLKVWEDNASNGKLEIVTHYSFNEIGAALAGRVCFDQIGTIVKFNFKAVEDLKNEDLANFKFLSQQGQIMFCVGYNAETGIGTCLPAGDLDVYPDGVTGENKILGIGEGHEHTVVPATCLEDGYCEVCKEILTEEHPALGHDCTVLERNDTEHWYKCSRCEEYTEGHEAHKDGVATCTEKGKCSVCEYEYVNELGHDFVIPESNDTHHWYKCSRCDQTDGEAEHFGGTATCTEQAVCEGCFQLYGGLLPHDYSVWKQDETRENHWLACSVCGEADETSRGAHEGGVANCTEDAVCDVCKQVYIDHTGHAYDENAGFDETHHWGICSNAGCPEVNGERTPHNEADPVYDESTREPSTCTSKGSCDVVVSCKDCGYEISRTNVLVDMIPHNFGEYQVIEEGRKPATCTEMGYHFEGRFCVDCGLEKEDARIQVSDDKIPHTYAHEAVIENTVDPTCTENGSYDEVIYCTVCNTELSRETKVIDKTGHVDAAAVEENKIPATCYSEGSYDLVTYCSVCNTELARTAQKIEKLSHTAGVAVTENSVAPDCVTDGSHDEVIYCTVPECKAELSRVKVTDPALGHNFTEAKSDETHHWNKCSECEAIDEKVAHAGGTATCTAQAVCENCSTAYGELLAHKFTEAKSDATHHWNKCSECEAIDEKVAHAGGTATCTAEAVCATCSTAYGEKLAHKFTEAKFDGTHHWNKCADCDAIDEKANHEFGEWKTTEEPTTKKEGEETRKCNSCEATEKQPVAKLPTDYTWLIVAVILVLAAAGIVVVVVLKKKRK